MRIRSVLFAIALALVLIALALAPVIGGGQGELAGAVVMLPVFLASIIVLFADRQKKLNIPPGTWAFAAFLIISALGAIFTECAYNSVRQGIFWFACLGAYVLSANLFNKKKALLPICVISLVAGAICLLTIRSQAIISGGGADFWQAVFSGNEIRVFGSFVNPNLFGGFLVLTIPLTIALLVGVEGLAGYAVFGVCMVVQVFALMLTSSKFSIVALGVAMAVFIGGIAIKRLPSKRQWIRLGVVLLLAAIIIIPTSASLRARVSESGSGGSQVHSTAFRIYTWKATAKMIADNPLAGVGLGNFEIAFPRYAIAALTKHAHQSYLQIAAESGILGFVAFICTLAAVAVAIVRSRVQSGKEIGNQIVAESIRLDSLPLIIWAVAGGLAGSGARALVDSDWYFIGISLPFWVLAGVLSGVLVPARQLDIKPAVKWSLSAIIVAIAALSVQFAIGDYIANVSDSPTRYALASSAVPWNPAYQRLMATRGATSTGEALSAADTAVRLAPKDAANYFARALVHLSANDSAEAIADLISARRFNPHSTQIMKTLAEIYVGIGKTSKAEQLYKDMLREENSPYETIKGVPELVDTSYAYAHMYLADKLLNKRNYKAALEHYESAAERLERWRSAKQFLQIAFSSGLLSSSEYQKNLETLRYSYNTMAECYQNLGQPEEAAKAIASASAIDTEAIPGSDMQE